MIPFAPDKALRYICGRALEILVEVVRHGEAMHALACNVTGILDNGA